MKVKKYPSGEYRLLEKIRKILGTAAAPDGKYPLTLGDDAAIRRGLSNERCVLTTDIAVEGVHFTARTMTFEEIGLRAMAANVSDCAAMAARPEAALVQLVFPGKTDNLQNKIIGLYRGFARACRKWDFKLVGGDLSAGRVWTIGITMIGTAPGRILKRTGIKNGDTLWVSGFPGRSAAGLAALKRWGRDRVPERYAALVGSHVMPHPPVDLGVTLGGCGKVHAMMDLSDGISKDARTLCYENKLGLEVSLDNLKVPGDMLALSRELRVLWKEWALHGGEEYELMFAASKSFCPADVPEGFRKRLVKLGVFNRNIRMFESGNVREIPRGSWDHTTIAFRQGPPSLSSERRGRP